LREPSFPWLGPLRLVMAIVGLTLTALLLLYAIATGWDEELIAIRIAFLSLVAVCFAVQAIGEFLEP
jgi:hypothetical protein